MKILFAGEGGQGIQAVAEILAKAAFNENKYVLYIPNFGVEQRGGVSLAFLVIDSQPVVYPKFEKADILAILSDRSWERVKNYVDEKTKVIFSPAVSIKRIPGVQIHPRGVLDTPPLVWNVFVLGKVNQVGNLVSLESLIRAMDERFAKQFKKNPDLRSLDIKALTKV